MSINSKNHSPNPTILFALLPGPDRRRHPSTYRYKLIYTTSHPGEPGCAMAWEVAGGRLFYQVALERTETGDLCWHCTCADAIYRGDHSPHLCKHVRGLIELGR